LSLPFSWTVIRKHCLERGSTEAELLWGLQYKKQARLCHSVWVHLGVRWLGKEVRERERVRCVPAKKVKQQVSQTVKSTVSRGTTCPGEEGV
jgi:hypothetical protein